MMKAFESAIHDINRINEMLRATISPALVAAGGLSQAMEFAKAQQDKQIAAVTGGYSSAVVMEFMKLMEQTKRMAAVAGGFNLALESSKPAFLKEYERLSENMRISKRVSPSTSPISWYPIPLKSSYEELDSRVDALEKKSEHQTQPEPKKRRIGF